MASKVYGGARKTVLIVEDQVSMRQVLCGYLQDAFPDCNFLVVGDGAGALEACRVYGPHLILLDKFLPDADGVELIPRLQRLNAEVQVIVMSHSIGEAYVQHALAAGARAYLVKDELAATLIPAVAAAIAAPAAIDEMAPQSKSQQRGYEMGDQP